MKEVVPMNVYNTETLWLPPPRCVYATGLVDYVVAVSARVPGRKQEGRGKKHRRGPTYHQREVPRAGGGCAVGEPLPVGKEAQGQGYGYLGERHTLGPRLTVVLVWCVVLPPLATAACDIWYKNSP